MILTDIIQVHLQQTIQYVKVHEKEFVQAVLNKTMSENKKEIAKKQREFVRVEQRVAEIDRLFQRLYEDRVTGQLSEDRFSRLSTAYEVEQAELSEKILNLRKELETAKKQVLNVSQFVELVKKYTEVRELTPSIVNEFISKIIIYAPDKSTGKRKQEIDIVYNFVGTMPRLHWGPISA